MMTKFIYAIKVACVLCCAALWSVDSYAQSATGYGEWTKKYFVDDFNDPMYDKPYIRATLVKPSSNDYVRKFLEIGFCTCLSALNYAPVFHLQIYNGAGDYTHFTGNSASISIKSVNGTVVTLTAPVENNGYAIVLIGNNATRFAKLINQGNCKVSVSVQILYDEQPTTWVFSCTNETKDIYKAAKSALNYSFQTY